ncbi:MAG TPA: MoxR family ATPase [Steroidobacteraceae bacterium]|nr:MoxR family ATPase [Steroidobacteraceae bacterium]
MNGGISNLATAKNPDPEARDGHAGSPAHVEFARLREYLSSQVIGQRGLIERLLITLLADGHLLVEGPPGLAKTRAIKALAQGIEADFHRLQFTPDLLPADLTGSEIYRPEEAAFRFQRGPLFHNLILADEVNRAPAKVQSALLEAMAERQISVGAATYALPRLFLVMATQNPIEHEGTYPLPEAQLDRFMLHTRVDYPDRATTLQIMRLARHEAATQQELPAPPQRLAQETVFAARREVLGLTLSEPVAEYIAALVDATRRPAPYSAQLAEWLRWGASPRAAIGIERGARAAAWLDGRDYVSPEDVQSVAADALRHRLLLDYAAQARGVTPQACVEELLGRVPAP